MCTLYIKKNLGTGYMPIKFDKVENFFLDFLSFDHQFPEVKNAMLFLYISENII